MGLPRLQTAYVGAYATHALEEAGGGQLATCITHVYHRYQYIIKGRGGHLAAHPLGADQHGLLPLVRMLQR